LQVHIKIGDRKSRCISMSFTITIVGIGATAVVTALQ